MSNLRIAMLSVHTCPLATLGGKETGGMNVYVRDLSRELASRGHLVDVYAGRSGQAWCTKFATTVLKYVTGHKKVFAGSGYKVANPGQFGNFLNVHKTS